MRGRTLAQRRGDRERAWKGYGTKAGRMRRERPAWQRRIGIFDGGQRTRLMPALQDPRVRGQIATRPL